MVQLIAHCIFKTIYLQTGMGLDEDSNSALGVDSSGLSPFYAEAYNQPLDHVPIKVRM